MILEIQSVENENKMTNPPPPKKKAQTNLKTKTTPKNINHQKIKTAYYLNFQIAFTSMQDMSEFSFVLHYVSSALLNTMTCINTSIFNVLHMNVFWLANIFPSDIKTVQPVNSPKERVMRQSRNICAPFWS